MIVMEGLMMVPPDRGTIIGRALWKPRYVVLSSGAPNRTQSDILSGTEMGRSGRKSQKALSAKPSLVDVSQPDDRLYLSIYKQKGDWESVVQHPISAFKTCEVRALQHRKQGLSLPTLVLEMKPDAAAEKQRKRRSSRSGALTSKDPWGTTLLFRSVSDDQYNIYDWQITLAPLLISEPSDGYEDHPLSPTVPVTYPAFTNPFASRDSKTVSNSNPRPELQQRSSQKIVNTNPQVSRERPSAMISPSPSLRSRRSDLSSQSSSMHPPVGFTSPQLPQPYASGLPSDLPSPASTLAYDTQFIEGWTSAQGRSSALSSHTRGSNSIASAVTPASLTASTPPGPRETILDRAFQMRCIPGSERMEDEKISSIARFEALMREVDERKRQVSLSSAHEPAQSSSWDLDEESEESSAEEDEDDELNMSDQEIEIPAPAQRALDFISGRRTPLSSVRPLSPPPRSPPIPFLNPQAMSAFHGHSSSHSHSAGLRPRTGVSTTASKKKRNSRPNSLALPSRSMSSTTIPSMKEASASSNASTTMKENRKSSTSVKRLSFTDFTKRLSSTSSLLLVQSNTNNSSSSGGKDGSRRGSSEYGVDVDDRGLRASVSLRGGGAPATSERDLRDKRCGWRGSVGVFGGEGGFL